MKQFWTNDRRCSARTVEKIFSGTRMDFPRALAAAIFICAPSVRLAKIGTFFRCMTNYLIRMDIDILVIATYAAPKSRNSMLYEVFLDAIDAIMMFVSSV